MKERHPDEADVVLMSALIVNRLVIAWPAMLLCVSTAPLGLPVVPEVYMISAGESLGMSTGRAPVARLGDQVVVVEHSVIGRRRRRR